MKSDVIEFFIWVLFLHKLLIIEGIFPLKSSPTISQTKFLRTTKNTGDAQNWSTPDKRLKE